MLSDRVGFFRMLRKNFDLPTPGADRLAATISSARTIPRTIPESCAAKRSHGESILTIRSDSGIVWSDKKPGNPDVVQGRER